MSPKNQQKRIFFQKALKNSPCQQNNGRNESREIITEIIKGQHLCKELINFNNC